MWERLRVVFLTAKPPVLEKKCSIENEKMVDGGGGGGKKTGAIRNI